MFTPMTMCYADKLGRATVCSEKYDFDLVGSVNRYLKDDNNSSFPPWFEMISSWVRDQEPTLSSVVHKSHGRHIQVALQTLPRELKIGITVTERDLVAPQGSLTDPKGGFTKPQGGIMSKTRLLWFRSKIHLPRRTPTVYALDPCRWVRGTRR